MICLGTKQPAFLIQFKVVTIADVTLRPFAFLDLLQPGSGRKPNLETVESSRPRFT